MRGAIPLLCAMVLAYSTPVDAQRVETLGTQVRKYLRVSTPKVILVHIEIIVGTGAAPKSDQNIPFKRFESRR